MGPALNIIFGVAALFFLIAVPFLLKRLVEVLIQLNNNLVEFMEYMKLK